MLTKTVGFFERGLEKELRGLDVVAAGSLSSSKKWTLDRFSFYASQTLHDKKISMEMFLLWSVCEA